MCWTHLGLEGKWVTALAQTEWGLYAGTHQDGVFLLNSETGKWESLGLDHAIISSILFLPGETKRLLVGVKPFAEEQTDAAVFASEDRGKTWIPWDNGLAARRGNRAWAYSLAMDPGNPERLFMGQSYPILRSEDAGHSWQYIWGNEDIFGMGINSIVVSPKRDGRIWAGGESGLFAGVVLRSDNWGESWKVFVPTPRRDNAVYALAVDQNNPERLWASMQAGVMRSDNGGEAWRYILNTRQPGSVYGILTIGQTLFAVSTEDLSTEGGKPGTQLGLYRSRDGGESWKALLVPVSARGGRTLTEDSRGQLLIGTRSGIWRVKP